VIDLGFYFFDSLGSNLNINTTEFEFSSSWRSTSGHCWRPTCTSNDNHTIVAHELFDEMLNRDLLHVETYYELPSGCLKPGENGNFSLLFYELDTLKIEASNYAYYLLILGLFCLQKLRAWKESWLASLVLIHQLLCLTNKYYYLPFMYTRDSC